GGIGARCRETEGTDAFGDLVHRQRQFVVLRLEHGVQGVEHRPGDVPMEVVSLQVEGVGVGQQAGQAFGDGRPVRLGNADVDIHGDSSELVGGMYQPNRAWRMRAWIWIKRRRAIWPRLRGGDLPYIISRFATLARSAGARGGRSR